MLNRHHHHQNKNLSPKMEKFPRDLLQRFVMSSGESDDNKQTQQEHRHQQHHHHQQQQHPEEEEQEEEEVELNLGLSLGGRFGVDKHAKKLMRSSSVVGTMPLHREEDAAVSLPPAAHPILMRTSSLPTETEEEWRKRKELQTLRRMEAKRRRSEKQRVSKLERESGGGGGGSGGGGGGLEEVEGGASATSMGLNRFGSSKLSPPPPFGLPSWARQVNLGDVLGKGKSGVGSFQGLLATQPSSQGSADSQGGSSSSVSEMESKPFLGSSSCAEGNQSLQEQSSHEALGSSGTKADDNTDCRTSRSEEELEKNLPSSKKPNPHPAKNHTGREIGTNSLGDMPCVFTKGDGPNGKRIEGILYRYGKGEEVRIMCVCHGRFLSPAQFVQHAGGSDVANPLKHIVVNPSAAPFL